MVLLGFVPGSELLDGLMVLFVVIPHQRVEYADFSLGRGPLHVEGEMAELEQTANSL